MYMYNGERIIPDGASIVLLCEIGLALVFTIYTLFSPPTHLNAASVNLYISLMFYCVGYLILPIFGEWTFQEPPLWLCMLSAIGHYGALPLCAAAIFGTSAVLWLSIYPVCAPPTRAIINYVLLITPWLVWTMICIGTYVVGVRNGDMMGRHSQDPFCSLAGSTLTIIMRILLFTFLIPGVVLQGSIICRTSILSRTSPKNFKLESETRDSIIRVSISTCVSLAIALALVFNPRPVAKVVLLGAFPLLSIFIMGTKNEIIWLLIKFLGAVVANS